MVSRESWGDLLSEYTGFIGPPMIFVTNIFGKFFLHHFPDTILLDISLYKTIYRGYTLIAPSLKLNTSASEVIERDGRWKEEGDPMYTGRGWKIQIQIQREWWEQETQCIQEEAVPPLCQRLMACSKHISIHHILTYSHTHNNIFIHTQIHKWCIPYPSTHLDIYTQLHISVV